jgi:hypothetical protein
MGAWASGSRHSLTFGSEFATWRAALMKTFVTGLINLPSSPRRIGFSAQFSICDHCFCATIILFIGYR